MNIKWVVVSLRILSAAVLAVKLPAWPPASAKLKHAQCERILFCEAVIATAFLAARNTEPVDFNTSKMLHYDIACGGIGEHSAHQIAELGTRARHCEGRHVSQCQR